MKSRIKHNRHARRRLIIAITLVLGLLFNSVPSMAYTGNYDPTNATAYGTKKSTSANSNKKLRTFILVTVTTNDATTYTVNVKAGVTSNYTGSATVNGCNLSYSSGKEATNGNKSKSDSSWKYSNSSSTNQKNFVDWTYTWTKSTTTQTMSITMSGYGNGGNDWGSSSSKSTASYTVTVPARQYYSCSCNPNNGGSNITVGGYYGYNVTLPAAPTKTGYTFTGWGSYGAGAVIAAQNLPGSLTAGWRINQYPLNVGMMLDNVEYPSLIDNDERTVGTFDITIGDTNEYSTSNIQEDDITDYSGNINYSTAYSITDIKANPGFVYDGVYSGSTSGTIGTSGATILLKFHRKTGTLTYNANGHGTMPASVTMDYWTAYSAAAAPANPSGYVFKEWNTRADGTGTSYAPGNTIKEADTDADDLTLYAIWKHPGTITITKTWDDDLQGSDQNGRTPPEVTIKGERVPEN